jgi:hypothetical protein
MAIGTTAAILGAAAIGAVGSVAAGAIGASAAEKAASVQASAADRAAALQEKQFETARADAMPWMTAGKTALDAYMGELGFGGPDFESKFTTTPDYDFTVKEGEKGVVNNLNALGMKNSGAALKALTRFRENVAHTFRGGYLDRLAGVANAGQNQVNQTNALGSQTATNTGNAIMAGGEARASGYVGAANSWTNAINNFTNTAGRALGRVGNSNGNPWNYARA